ncbi:uncharacterized protein LOC116293498 [Actinia tenebrosa]|uniref:Uncharacterized protein LOC116293498 n=1 Tax=Actinia tenebrosa TaxID=6105 RepID=A0A6P8HM36_ACTTE|nr:uncharacterized protein LOC116293498 [Actinia tenebrosa]
MGREWKSVLSYMRRHAEVMGEAGDQYLVEDKSPCKALQERIRKRASKLLNNALLTRNDDTTSTDKTQRETPSTSKIIDDEYESSQSSSEESAKQEIAEICKAINTREMKYVVDVDDKNLQHDDSTEILKKINNRRELEKEEDRKRTSVKPENKSSKRQKVTREDRLDRLLDAIPGVLESAQTAAREHKKALASWRTIHGLVSSDED